MKTDERNSRLKNSGLKCTKHRLNILKILEQSKQPVPAEQIYLLLKEQKDDISLSTVYRILDLLVAKQIVLKMNTVEDGRALFELNRMVHRHYLICLKCHKMLPIEDCPLDEYEKQLAGKTGFFPTGHNLEIYGYCRECNKKRR